MDDDFGRDACLVVAVDDDDRAAINAAIEVRRECLPMPGEADDAGAVLAEVCRGWLDMVGRIDRYHAKAAAVAGAAGCDDQAVS